MNEELEKRVQKSLKEAKLLNLQGQREALEHELNHIKSRLQDVNKQIKELS